MKILGYTCRRYLKATLSVVGNRDDILVSPPMMAYNFQPYLLEGYDAIYLDLHGMRGSVRLWSGPQLWAALDIKTVLSAGLSGTVVFATSCYLTETLFPEAFLQAGAKCVVAGAGRNYGLKNRAMGAQKLARLFFDQLRGGLEPETALASAKTRLSYSISRFLYPKSTADALQFNIIWEKDNARDGPEKK